MKRCVSIVVGVPAVLLAATGAGASITGWSGQAQPIAAPASCAPNVLLLPFGAGWDEQQGVPVANLLVNESQNPGGNIGAIPGLLTGVVDSHFIHWQGSTVSQNVTGSFTFSGTIVGVEFRALELDNTDFLGAGGTTYPTGYPFRGLTTGIPSSFTVLGNTLNFHFNDLLPSPNVVQLRVFTLVPTPGAAALCALGGVMAAGRRRRA
mgnify:CR=1 FL=1